MKKPLSVRAKILLTVVTSVLALSFVAYLISSEVLLKSYRAIEEEGMVEDLRRAKDAINEFSNQQMIKLSDWAAWDEAYGFVQDRDMAWATETVYDTGLANLDINAMIWSDNEGTIFHIMVVDIYERTEVASTTIATYFADHTDLITNTEIEENTQGIVMLPDGPLIVVSRPSLTSEGEGPINGSITFARYLDDAKIQEFSEITHLSIQAFPYNGELPQEVQSVREQIEGGAPRVITPLSRDMIVGYEAINDIYGDPVLILRVETPRPIYAQGQLTFLLFMGIGALAFLIFGILILWLLDRLVIARFVRLTNDVDKINDVQNLSIRVQGGVKDEIGKLADKINQMLAWLASSQEEIRTGKERAEEMVRVRTKELSEEKARLLASINSLSFGFVIADTDGVVLLKNPSLVRILGLSAAPANVREIAKAFDSFDLMEFCTQSVARKVPAEKADLLYGKQFLRLLCAPIFAEGDVEREIIGYALLIEDITEAKVNERSREEFFSIASHELRTPLTAIHGNTDLLLDTYKDKLPDSEMREMLEDINASSKRLISIVNDFLQVSRLEQGRMEIKREAFDLAPVIESVVRNLDELAHKAGLTLTYDVGTLPQVMADRDRTEQVLDNLIGNAIKFTEHGSIRVTASLEDGEVKVRVIDTGVGISEQNQARLFRKFQQAGEDMLARNASQSTGLGLYISKLMMGAMGGEIRLEASRLGQGSTFSFTLPLA